MIHDSSGSSKVFIESYCLFVLIGDVSPTLFGLGICCWFCVLVRLSGLSGAHIHWTPSTSTRPPFSRSSALQACQVHRIHAEVVEAAAARPQPMLQHPTPLPPAPPQAPPQTPAPGNAGHPLPPPPPPQPGQTQLKRKRARESPGAAGNSTRSRGRATFASSRSSGARGRCPARGAPRGASSVCTTRSIDGVGHRPPRRSLLRREIRVARCGIMRVLRGEKKL